MSADSGDPIEPELAAMLDAERARDDVDAAMRARLFKRLAIAVGGPSGNVREPAAPAPSQTPGIARRGPIRAWQLGAGMFALGGAFGFAMHAAIVSAPRPVVPNATSAPTLLGPTAPGPIKTDAPSPTSAVSTESTPPIAVPAPSLRVPAPVVAGPASHPSVSRTSPVPSTIPASIATGSPGDRSMEEERVVLETARAALVRGDAGGALDAIATHAARFPDGRLAEEREGLRVEALVRAGRYGEARARADQFRQRFPKSLLLPVVDAAVKSIP